MVEDDIDEANAAVEAVEEMRSPTTAEATPSGDRALRLLAGERFDGVVLAFDLADLSGLEVVRRLRETDEETPVIVWTNRDAPALEDELRQAGADAYLTKRDHDIGRVREALERHLQG